MWGIVLYLYAWELNAGVLYRLGSCIMEYVFILSGDVLCYWLLCLGILPWDGITGCCNLFRGPIYWRILFSMSGEYDVWHVMFANIANSVVFRDGAEHAARRHRVMCVSRATHSGVLQRTAPLAPRHQTDAPRAQHWCCIVGRRGTPILPRRRRTATAPISVGAQLCDACGVAALSRWCLVRACGRALARHVCARAHHTHRARKMGWHWCGNARPSAPPTAA